MISITTKHVRAGLVLLAAGSALVAMPAAAQQPYQQYAPYKEDPGTALNRHLRTLADQPRNLSALMGAGKAALQLGDAQAALTFFARAEEIAPRDGRVKAGMGSAFLAMEQPIPAMKFFDEAMALGVPEAEFSGDRGLAFDLAGNFRRAQADYTMALRREEDPEVRRRLALSLAISGNRNQALATIDDQLRRQDRAAWRTRAFIMALSGDVAEASRTTESVMPGMASQLSPFYARLASLSPAQRAAAVHFGHMPTGAGTQYAGIPQYPQPAPPAARQSVPQPARVTSAPQSAPPAQRQQRTQAARERYDPFDRFGSRSSRSARAQERSAATAQTRPAPAPSLAVPRQQSPVVVQAPPVQAPSQAAQAQRPVSGPPADAPVNLPQQQPVVQAPAVLSQQTPAAQSQPVITPAPAPGFSSDANPIQQAAPAPATIVPVEIAASTVSQPSADTPAATPAPAATPPAERSSTAAPGFADIAAAIAKLPSDGPPMEPAPTALAQLETKPAPKPVAPREEPRKATPAPKKEEPAKDSPKKQDASKKEAAKKEEPTKKDEPGKKEPGKKEALTKKEEAAKKAEAAKKTEPAKPKEPSRIWVQVAGGADKNALPREYARLKDKAGKLLAGQSAWTTPLRFTNRLLVGPFKSEKEAQELVNGLNKVGFSAFTWTSPAGQEIEKLGK